ncbi:hypothetical protein ACVWYR_001716 [Pantoea agglomerans]
MTVCIEKLYPQQEIIRRQGAFVSCPCSEEGAKNYVSNPALSNMAKGVPVSGGSDVMKRDTLFNTGNKIITDYILVVRVPGNANFPAY